MQKLSLTTGSNSISVEISKSTDPQYVLILAHGAGAGMHHPFMTSLSSMLSDLNAHVIRFNFPYMEQGRKSPGGPKQNILAIHDVFDYTRVNFPDFPLFLSGKSYGGRMSSHLVVEQNILINGLIYFGFPLHAPGRDSKDRATHLYQIKVPQLFIQGTRDKLANHELMSQVVSDCQEGSMVTIEHGDHSFKVPKRLTGLATDDILKKLAVDTNNWIISVL